MPFKFAMRFFAVEVLSMSVFLAASCLLLLAAAAPSAATAESAPVLPNTISAALGHSGLPPAGVSDGGDARHFRPGTSVAVGVVGAFALLQGAPRMALLISL